MTHPDPELKPLADAARRREAARVAWQQDPHADPELKAPLSRAERQALLAAVVPAPPRRLWPALTAGAGLVAAAVVALLMLAPGPELPDFHLELHSQGYQAMRGPDVDAKKLELRNGMRLQLVLRPESRPEGPVHVQVFLRTADGDSPVSWAPETSGDGAYRFSGQVGRQVVLTAQSQALVFVIGSPRALASGERTEGVQVHVQPVHWAP